MLNLRKPIESELYSFSRNKIHSHVEAIRYYGLVLKSRHVLKFKIVFYIPSFFVNLISISKLVPFEYSFLFNKESMKLLFKPNVVGNDTISNGLFKLDL